MAPERKHSSNHSEVAFATQEIPALLKATYDSWTGHNAPRLGAALAYYALLSTAPLAILLVAICSLVLDEKAARTQVLSEAAQLLGPGASNLLSGLINNTRHSSGVMATVVAFLTLLFGSSGVFLELKSALNTIWDAPPEKSSGVWGFAKQRLLAFVMVVALGALLLGSLLLSTVLAVLEKFTTGWVPVSAQITSEIVNGILTFGTLAVLFAAIYKLIPNVPIRWKDVVVGAVATSGLFVAGKVLLALYLTKAAVGSAYGAAGSLVAYIVWVYYSAQIFFFGAVFTQAYADRAKGKI